MTIISNCSSPSQSPKAQSQNPSVQTAIPNLSVETCFPSFISSTFQIRSSEEVTKIKQLVRERVWVRKKTDLVPLVHTTVPIWNAYLAHTLTPTIPWMLCVLTI